MKQPKKSNRGAAVVRPYHHGNLRTALIDTGLDMLSRSSGADLSLRELARQTGVSSAAVYRHFATKEDFRAAVSAEGYRRLAAAGATARAGLTDPVDAIRATGFTYIQFARHNPALFKMMFEWVDPAYRTDERSAAVRAALSSIYSDMARALDLDINDPRIALGAIHAWSHVHGLSVLILEGKLDQGPVDVERLIELVANGYQPPTADLLR